MFSQLVENLPQLMIQIIVRTQLSQGFDWLTVTTLVVTCLDLVMMVTNGVLWNLLDSGEKKSQSIKEEAYENFFFSRSSPKGMLIF